MHFLTGTILQLYNYLPYIIAIIAILAVILGVVIIFSIARAIKRAKKKKLSTLSPEQTKSQGSEGEASEARGGVGKEKPPYRGGSFMDYIMLKGYLSVGDFSLSFLRALDFLKSHLGGSDPLYTLPWYLTIGAKESGKSTLFGCSGLNLPVGRPNFTIKEVDPECNWWLLNHGIILDIKGCFVLDKHQVIADEQRWNLLLLLLNRYRPKRPLDGIILTIPVEELIGNNKLTHNEITSRARALYLKLVQAQDTLGMKMPIYIVFTKCDLIGGFQNFCQALPSPTKEQMFGWSCPYALDVAYAPSWVDDIFYAVTNTIEHIKMQMYVASSRWEQQEDIMLFSRNVMELKEGVALYLNQLFKFTSYHESFFLRGVYFAGDQGPSDRRSQSSTGEFVPIRLKTADIEIGECEPLEKHDICFVHDLLNNKVFREFALAHPMAHKLKADQRSVLVARAIVIATATLCFYGAYRSYDSLKNTRKALLPVLYQIEYALGQAQDKSLSDSQRLIFDEQAPILLRLMSHVHSMSFRSFFITPSWFSSLNQDIHKVIGVAFNKIILQSIHYEFARKAYSISEGFATTEYIKALMQELSLSTPLRSTSLALLTTATSKEKQKKPENQEFSWTRLLHSHQATKQQRILKGKEQPKIHTIDPKGVNAEAIPEFIALKDFVYKLLELEEMVKFYSQLPISKSQADISKITKYLFNYDLPAESLVDLHEVMDVKAVTKYQVNLLASEASARETFKRFFAEYMEALMSLGERYKPINELLAGLNNFISTDKAHLSTAEQYRQLSHILNEAVDFINKPDLDWLDREKFEPGEDYATLIVEAARSSLLGADAVLEAVHHANEFFKEFKIQLAKLSNPLSGTIFEVHDGHLVSKPSKGVENLKDILAKFYSEPFMAVAVKHKLQTTIPEGQRLLWDVNLLKNARALITAYEQFINQKLKDYPKDLHGVLRTAGEQSLREHVASLLAQAQIFNNDIELLSTPEEKMRAQIPNLQEAMPYLTRFLTLLKSSQTASVYVELRDLLASLAYNLLEHVDALLKEEQLYPVKEGNFEWWDGASDIALAAFNVRDEQDLKSFLSIQRNRIMILAKEFAAPLIALLGQADIQGGYVNLTLFNKWARIVAQTKTYNSKKPDNSILVLENFILKDMKGLKLDSCFEKIKQTDLGQTSGDYFLRKRNSIRKMIYRRCGIVGEGKVHQGYIQLSEFFNRYLAGKFPFVTNVDLRNDDIKEEGEARPEDVRIFFKMFEEFEPTIKHVLNNSKAAGETEILAFLKRLTVVRDFLDPLLSFHKTGNPGIQIKADFRVNRTNEVNGHEIIEWVARLGRRALDAQSTKEMAEWHIGDPVSIELRWARNSSSIPVGDSNKPNLNIERQAAKFGYSGHWALLWMLRNHAISHGDYKTIAHPEPVLAEFEIPTIAAVGDNMNYPDSTSSDFSRVYIQFALMGPSKKGKKLLVLPPFPSYAPELYEEEEEEEEYGDLDTPSSWREEAQ